MNSHMLTEAQDAPNRVQELLAGDPEIYRDLGRKMRELGAIFRDAGFWKDADDLFYLNRQEVRDALFDYGNGWAVGAPAIGPHHAGAEARDPVGPGARQAPPPGLGAPPGGNDHGDRVPERGEAVGVGEERAHASRDPQVRAQEGDAHAQIAIET